MLLGKVFEEAFEVVRREGFEARGHERELGAFELGDVLALDDVLHARGVEDFDGGLGLGFEPAGEGFAVLGGHVP